MVRYGLSSVGEEVALHADICDLGSGFLATEYIMKSRHSRPKPVQVTVFK